MWSASGNPVAGALGVEEWSGFGKGVCTCYGKKVGETVMEQYCFGIDVGGTSVKMGLFTIEGTLVKKWEIRANTEGQGRSILPDIRDSLAREMEEGRLSGSQILGIGVGVPGPVDHAGILHGAVNLGWGTFPIEEELSRLTGFPVYAANDANLAALGELFRGGGMGCKNMVFVTLGTGVGGGIIVQEEILAGSHGAAGEIGHLHVSDSEETPCACGNRGCLEQYASAVGIVRLAERMLADSRGESSLRGLGSLTAKDIFDAARAGDALALEIGKAFGNYLGTALANVASVADPEVFVIGGGMSGAGEILLSFLEGPYRANAFHPCKNTGFVLARLGNDAGIYGACKLVLQRSLGTDQK